MAAGAAGAAAGAVVSEATSGLDTGALNLRPNTSIACSSDELRKSSASDLNGATAQTAATVLPRTVIVLKYDSGSLVSCEMMSGNAPSPRPFHKARPSAFATYKPRPAANGRARLR